ncbi:MAG: carboxypeptidase-like regulatory domain-containing protein [Isosphaeraceae bacterium]|nr:carboxypeptidase-like regulatory domain-containing protein [Isosphaeraceae bacterium]
MNCSAARYVQAAIWGAALLLGAAGCGGGQQSTVALVPAVGTVTIDGAPLPEAVVQFIPAGETRGQGGSGLTNAEGAYKAATPFGEPGLPTGEYKVVISKRALPTGTGAAAAAGPDAEVLAPAYSDMAKTTLKARVPAGGEATNDFALRAVKKPPKG